LVLLLCLLVRGWNLTHIIVKGQKGSNRITNFVVCESWRALFVQQPQSVCLQVVAWPKHSIGCLHYHPEGILNTGTVLGPQRSIEEEHQFLWHLVPRTPLPGYLAHIVKEQKGSNRITNFVVFESWRALYVHQPQSICLQVVTWPTHSFGTWYLRCIA
jgi:hypothetical protein